MERQIDLRGLEGARRLLAVAASASDDRVRKALERRSALVFMKACGLHLLGPRNEPVDQHQQP